MDKLLSDIKEGIAQFSKERQSLTHINEEKKQFVLSELNRLQRGVPVLNKHANQSRNREYKNTIFELDTQLDDEIVAWENIITESSETNTEPKTTETITETTTEPKTTETTTETTTEPKTTTTTETTSEPKITKTISEPKTTTTSETTTEPKTTKTISEPKTTTPSTHKKGEDEPESPKKSNIHLFKTNPITKPPEALVSYWSNLFIELDLNESGYFLSLYDHVFTNRYENASTEKDSMPFIIGLIGDTHVGKSAMIEPIMKSLTEREMKKMIIQNSKMNDVNDENKKFQGNTANIALFSTDKLEGTNNSKIYVLDMEGTSANSTPSILEQGLMWFLKETPPGVLRSKLQKMLSDPVKRNTAVDALIPPLAYLVCDMLIFISTDTFDNSSYIQRVSKFTKSINIQANDRPALVLISNKVNVAGSVFDDCTKKFFSLETKDGEKLVSVETFLKAWYSSITCICLPNWNEASYASHDNDSFAMVSVGAIKYIEQIGKLKSVISTEIQKRKDLRNQYGQHLSEKTLLATLKHFLKFQMNYSDQTKRLLDYYNFTISNVSGEVNLVFRVFEILISKINKACEDPENVIKNFNKICEFAMIYLAIHISLLVRKQIDTAQHVTEIAPNWKTEAHQLIDLLNKSQLCFSHTTYRLPEGNLEIKRVYRCTKDHKRHLSDHYSNQQLFAPDATWGYVQKFFTSLKSFFGIGYYPRWDGEFKPHPYVKTSNDLEYSFEKAIKTVFMKNSLEECLHYAAILMKSLTDEDPIDVSINNQDDCVEINYCSICFDQGKKKLCNRCQIIWEKVQISKDWRLIN